MYYTPKSYKSSSPRISSSVRPNSTFGPTNYPTPPQTHRNTDYLPIPSTSITMAGLGIQNCGVESLSTQLPICAPSQPLLQPAQCWPQATPSSGSFSNPSPNMGEYDRFGLFDDIAGLPIHESSPFVVPSSHANTPDQFAFFSPHQQQQSTVGNPVVQRGLVLDEYGMAPRSGPIPKQQQRMGKPTLAGGGSSALPMSRVPLKRPFTHVESPPTQAPASVSPYVGHNLPNTPLQTGSNVGRPVDHSRMQRSPLGSSNVNTQVEPTTSAPVHDQPVKRQRTRSTAVVKYKCEKCGKVFTRNSNRKSHMKTHDPNRNFPHKCTYGHCTKEFSRKTDLARHVDSVHKKSRKFGCDQCGERFARRDTLRRHCDDGCRRRQRQSQRSGNTTVPVTGSHPTQHTYQQPVTTSEAQTLPTFIGQSFPGSGPDSFSQLIA